MADVGLFEFGELQQQLALFVGDLLGDFDMNLDEQVARSAAARIGHAASAYPKNFARLCARGDRLLFAAVERRDFDLGTQHRLRIGDRDVADPVWAVAFEQFVGFDANLDEQVAARPAVGARFALAAQTELHARVDARRHADLQPRLLDVASSTAAIRTLVADDLPFAAAGGARGLNPEEALRLHDLSVSFAVIASGRR